MHVWRIPQSHKSTCLIDFFRTQTARGNFLCVGGWPTTPVKKDGGSLLARKIEYTIRIKNEFSEKENVAWWIQGIL